MKIAELLAEQRGAQLYHWMNAEKAVSVFSSNSFDKLWKHETKEGTFYGTSMSRNPKFTYGEKPVRLTFDQTKLAQRFKMMPLDAERAFGYSIGGSMWYRRKDRVMNAKSAEQYAEEFVIGEIKNLHKYITHIEVSKHIRRDVQNFLSAVQAYSDKYKLKLTIASEVLQFLKDQEAAYDDE